MIPWWATEFGEPEIAAVTAAINNRNISQGKVTRQFEEALAEVLGVPYVVCTTSGTTALTMALLAVGAEAAIIPNRTWIATAHAALMAGVRVHLSDVGPRGVLDDISYKATVRAAVSRSHRDASEPRPRIFHTAGESTIPAFAPSSPVPEHSPADEHREIDPGAWGGVRAYIWRDTENNSSVVRGPSLPRTYHNWDSLDALGILPKRGTIALPVHLNGRYAYVPRDRLVIEDACQAFPKKPEGVAACYSMSTAKLLPTGQGGFVATSDENLYRELRAIRTHDVEDAMIPQVLTWKRWGYNFRFTDIQAAIGLAQLASLQSRIDRLNEIRSLYEELMPDAEMPKADGVPLYAELLHPEPEKLRAHLLNHGIEARPFYPSLHTAPYLMPANKTKYHDYEFPNSEKWSKGVILPSGPNQRLADIRRVCEAFHGYRN